MKKNIFGRRFKRDVKQRKALFKSLMSSLVLNDRIRTTEAKAKAIKADVDKLITKVKKGEDTARRFLAKSLSPQALEKLISKITPRFQNRQSGYTRIIKLPKRVSDHASMVIMEWVEKTGVEIEKTEVPKQKVTKKKQIAKKSIKKTSKENKKVRPLRRRKKTETQKRKLRASE